VGASGSPAASPWWSATRPQHQGRTTTSPAKRKNQSNWVGRRKVGPTGGLATSPEVGLRGHCRYPADRVPRIYALSKDKEQGVHPHTVMCPTAPDLTPLLRWLLAVPCVLQLRTSPPCQGGLQHSHVSHGPGPCLTARVGPSAATCSVAPGLSS
jgi:hypothetical protein